MFEFLHKVALLGTAAFYKFDEDAVKNNFTMIYEIMDGIIQNTELDSLMITTESIKNENVLDKGKRIAIQATGSVSWRRPDIKYRSNEAFIDIIESVNILVSSQGSLLKSDVSGSVMMRAYLTGMPECKFGLNDKQISDFDKPVSKSSSVVALDDCQFHQCVKLGSFDENKTIHFIPPDGEFQLMKYRSTENVQLPFKIQAIVNQTSNSKVEYKILLKAQFSQKVFAQSVVIKIPTPTNCATTKIIVSGGKAKYNGSENCMIWKIARIQGGQELSMSANADLSLTSVAKVWSRPPITMDFEVLMFTSSGLIVRYLRIFEKSNYNTIKWVRYLTKAGTYQFRI